jgi:drug/metabolite transporter (DMT)-like permease
MADMLPAGIALAAAAAVSFEAGYLLQALEARQVAGDVTTRGILGALVRRRRWLAGLVLAATGAVLQVLALRVAPLTVVQPVLALGVVALVVVGGRVLGEPARPADLVAALALAAGVTLIAISDPGIEAGSVSTAPAAVALCGLGALLAVAFAARGASPALLVAGAGAGDALAALAAARLAGALDPVAVVAVAWLGVAAVAVVASLSVEMSAIRAWPATRVGPFVLVAQTVVPVLLAPVVVGEDWFGRAPTVVGGLGLVAAGAWRLAASARLLEHPEPPAQDLDGGR